MQLLYSTPAAIVRNENELLTNNFVEKRKPVTSIAKAGLGFTSEYSAYYSYLES